MFDKNSKTKEDSKSKHLSATAQLEQSKGVDYTTMMHFTKFYALPLFSLIIFLSIVFFPIRSEINKISDTRDEISDLSSQSEQLDGRIVVLEGLNTQYEQNQDIIDRINRIIPTGRTEVVKFSDNVVGTAVSVGLVVHTAKAGEIIRVNVDEQDSSYYLVEIPSEFSIDGPFFVFRRYLNLLYTGDDFFVVSKMDLGTSATADDQIKTWGGELNFVKYQFFADNSIDLAETFAAVSESEQPNQVVIDFLETRFID